MSREYFCGHCGDSEHAHGPVGEACEGSNCSNGFSCYEFQYENSRSQIESNLTRPWRQTILERLEVDVAFAEALEQEIGKEWKMIELERLEREPYFAPLLKEALVKESRNLLEGLKDTLSRGLEDIDCPSRRVIKIDD